ncbi:vacuolar protein sorting-associated protein vta1 [Holotrichia oblita]|uniref:Vacuolar protein sorting-associated protein vta1 n=1 Tax=Holotrichia oblita TaxID=644536 RepID=A0ACB9TEP3_HOLOL|nr:vacuolar protein sorting-associated protein vta1 [Holotrichia oblita]
MGFPPVPHDIKAISHFLKVADEHDQRNVTVSYWCRMYAVQSAMKIIPGPKSQEVSQLLIAIMDWLERTKIEKKDVEGISNEMCAQAIIEEYAIKLFNYAETQDKESRFDKNMVKSFYTSGILFDILDQFGTLSEDIEEKRKYAKWRAAYIHNCLKKLEVPHGAPIEQSTDNSCFVVFTFDYTSITNYRRYACATKQAHRHYFSYVNAFPHYNTPSNTALCETYLQINNLLLNLDSFKTAFARLEKCIRLQVTGTYCIYTGKQKITNSSNYVFEV